MTRAHASDRTSEGAVYETEAATVSVRPRRVDGGRTALEYAVQSEHPAPIAVRVRQPLPASIDLDDLGFPGDCGEDWERDGDDLLFEHDIAPDDTVSTAWGVEGELGDDLEPPEVDADPVSIDAEEIPEFDADGDLLDGPPTGEGDASGDADIDVEEAPDSTDANPADSLGPDPDAVLDLDLDDPDADGSLADDGAADAVDATGDATSTDEADDGTGTDGAGDETSSGGVRDGTSSEGAGGVGHNDGAGDAEHSDDAPGTSDGVANGDASFDEGSGDANVDAAGGDASDDAASDDANGAIGDEVEAAPSADGLELDSDELADLSSSFDTAGSDDEADADGLVPGGESVDSADDRSEGPAAQDAGDAVGDLPDADPEPDEQPDDGDASDGAGAGVDPDESLILQLVEELHDDEVDDSHRAALADALEVRLSDSTNAFVEHVRDRQRRQTERVVDDLEALEDSVEGLYGVKADASEVSTLKKAITRLDDAKAGDADLRELRARVGDLAESTADHETVETLRADHESLAESLAATDDELAALEESATDDRESIRSTVGDLEAEHDALAERSATEERVDTVADDLATLRDAAATEAALDDLAETVEALESEAAMEDDLEELRSELSSVESRLADRVDLLADRHDDLAAEAATDDALDALRETHRDRLNATTSEIQALRETVEAEYSTDDELRADIDRRIHWSLGRLVAFGIGTVGIVATIPLAIAGSPAAAATFLGGAGTLGLWWRSIAPDALAGGTEAGAGSAGGTDARSDGDDADGGSSLRDLL